MALEELQNGRYHRLRLLGSGGMGEVYLMEDTRINRQVAIKVIRSEDAVYLDTDSARDATRLFQREARAIAALEHPNILPLYDFGEETLDEMTITYMVMPFCAEGSLAGWLRQRGDPPRLSLQDITHLIEQAADALQNAHDHHIIHLDVKPSNFLLRGNPKNPNRPLLLLADFGIARNSTTIASSSLTIRGTPATMAPEQWSGTPVAATDQYALAVMAYEMLTGRPPFLGSLQRLMYQHFTIQPSPPSTFNPQLSPAINKVLLRALAKQPEDRFPSVSAFANAFEQAVQTLPAELVDDPTAARAEPPPHTSEPDVQQPSIPDDNPPTAASSDANLQAPEKHPQPALHKRRSAPRSRLVAIISGLIIVALLLILLTGTAYVYGNHQASVNTPAHSQTTTASTKPGQTSTDTSTGTITSTLTPQNGLYIAGTYKGSMFDQITQQTQHFTLFIGQNKGYAPLRGLFVPGSPSQQYSLNGTIDTQGNFSFTVQQAAGQTPLYFYGKFQQDYLRGNYCSSSTNSCSVSTGYFQAGPRY